MGISGEMLDPPRSPPPRPPTQRPMVCSGNVWRPSTICLLMEHFEQRAVEPRPHSAFLSSTFASPVAALTLLSFRDRLSVPACGFCHLPAARMLGPESRHRRKIPEHVRPVCFGARHFVLCLRLGEREVSVCGPGGNPQASVVFASLPDAALVLSHALAGHQLLAV